ncbi:SMP-30/gluconolactonase/LRE family protein [Phenylobacterium sp.]|jgi:sugar lactone lactonase YvrE|uniref:SMP-30/gluconolactonase/LRE family protein n=1 Tax=Phenylobacterium sp. TaxID=1871053 RepID=UPI002ED8D429
MGNLRTLQSDLSFGEAPRWRPGEGLYVSDIHANRILRLSEEGGAEVVATFDGPVSGLGWLPDGTLLVVSMHDRRLLRREPGGTFRVHADLSGIATWHANDMVVAADGTAYVGNFGFSLTPRLEVKPAKLAKVTPDGRASVAAEGLLFPNGSVISPDGRTLIVGESAGRRLTAFTIDDNGELSDQRAWAPMPEGAFPDGICLDAEGAIWVASPPTREVLRIREGGDVLERIPTEQMAIAAMLGGADRRTLFICTADSTDPEYCLANHTARILAVEVDVPGAGYP